MGNAGILIDAFRPEELAELFGLVCHDRDLKQSVLAAQQKRVEAVLNRPVKAELLALLADFIPTESE